MIEVMGASNEFPRALVGIPVASPFSSTGIPMTYSCLLPLKPIASGIFKIVSCPLVIKIKFWSRCFYLV